MDEEYQTLVVMRLSPCSFLCLDVRLRYGLGEMEKS